MKVSRLVDDAHVLPQPLELQRLDVCAVNKHLQRNDAVLSNTLHLLSHSRQYQRTTEVCQDCTCQASDNDHV